MTGGGGLRNRFVGLLVLVKVAILGQTNNSFDIMAVAHHSKCYIINTRVIGAVLLRCAHTALDLGPGQSRPPTRKILPALMQQDQQRWLAFEEFWRHVAFIQFQFHGLQVSWPLLFTNNTDAHQQRVSTLARGNRPVRS